MKPPITPEYCSDHGALYKVDCLTLFANIRSNSIQCIFADPPFNLGKNYGSRRVQDHLPEDDYLNWVKKWLIECERVLAPGGSLFVYHVPKWLMAIGGFLNTLPDMEFRHWIAVKMKNGFPIKNRLHPAHYGVLYYVKKGSDFTFNVVRTPSPTCRHCGKLLRDYGGYKNRYKTQKKTNIPLIQLADFWEDTTPKIHRKTRPKSINELPLSIPERIILMSTVPGDIVLDPFVGGGSTLRAAQMHKRYWIGSEIATTVHAQRHLLDIPSAVKQRSLPKKLQSILTRDVK